jgi:sugar lactone lactonase YvrE
MKNILLIAFCLIAHVSSSQTLNLKWRSDTLLRVPESVLFDAGRKALYVSNIDGKSDGKDGEGFISQLTTDGKIKNLKWVTGLDAPKGLGMVGNNLYVADLTAVVIIDIPSGKITDRIELNGAIFLNDVTTTKDGTVYISDSTTGKIFSIKDKKQALYFESTEFTRINGLLALKDGLYVADFGSGVNFKLSADKKLSKFSETAQGADGVVHVGKNEYIVSSWHGELYYVNAKGESTKILDTKDQKISAADIEYDPKTMTVFVPTFFANSVMAYELSR